MTPKERGGLRRVLPPRKRKMDATVFELALQRVRPIKGKWASNTSGQRGYDGARMVMVEGRTVTEAQRLCRVSRQAIYLAMDKVQGEFEKLGICSACGQKLPNV